MATRKSSILTLDMDKCYICGSYRDIEIHHIFGGANKKNSEKYGLIVPLCHYCHNEPPYGVHFDRDRMIALRRTAQRMFESIEDHKKFMEVFGRNYL